MEPTDESQSDPTPAEIIKRAAAVRAGWSDRVERARRVEKYQPVVYWPVGDDWLPAESWPEVPI